MSTDDASILEIITVKALVALLGVAPSSYGGSDAVVKAKLLGTLAL